MLERKTAEWRTRGRIVTKNEQGKKMRDPLERGRE
jgi:hypothetical protein